METFLPPELFELVSVYIKLSLFGVMLVALEFGVELSVCNDLIIVISFPLLVLSLQFIHHC